jgi:hypothetical protein
MTIREMLLAQSREMTGELQSLNEYERYGDDGYDDLSNGLEFLSELLVLDYELTDDQAVEAVEVLFIRDRDFDPMSPPEIAGCSLVTLPCHMLGLDSLAPEIRDEFYRRHPDERI